MAEIMGAAVCFWSMWALCAWAERRRASRRCWLDALGDAIAGDRL